MPAQCCHQKRLQSGAPAMKVMCEELQYLCTWLQNVVPRCLKSRCRIMLLGGRRRSGDNPHRHVLAGVCSSTAHNTSWFGAAVLRSPDAHMSIHCPTGQHSAGRVQCKSDEPGMGLPQGQLLHRKVNECLTIAQDLAGHGGLPCHTAHSL